VTSAKRALETFPAPDHVQSVTFASDELTSLCPLTGQPDFNSIEIRYAPDQRCIESKSLKLYLNGYRNEAQFCEALAVKIRNDVAEAVELPGDKVRVILEQKSRGGITITATS
jgi:7-cyano-7-deazaguanine reductase